MHNLTVFWSMLHRASFLHSTRRISCLCTGCGSPQSASAGELPGYRKGDPRFETATHELQKTTPGRVSFLSPRSAPPRVSFLSRGSSQALRQRSLRPRVRCCGSATGRPLCRVCTCPFPRWNDLNKRGLRTGSRTRKFTAEVVLRLGRLPCNLVRLGAALMAAVRASSMGSPPLPMRSACSLERSSRSTWVCHATESTRFAAQPTD